MVTSSPDAYPAAKSLRQARDNFAQGRSAAARELCQGILREFPDHAGASHLLGVMAHLEGNHPEAQTLLRRAAESPGTTALYVLSYAELCCKGVDRAAALAATRRAIALDGTLPLGWLCLGDLLLETRQLAESRGCYERALELDPRVWQARTGLAMVLSRLGDTAAALRDFELLLREQPDNAEARGSYAALLQDLGRYEDALSEAERAAAQRPDLLDLHLRAADIELQLGRHWPALARLDAIEKTRPAEVKLLTLKAHLLRLVDHYDEAVALCRDAVSKGLESADLLRAFGLALHIAGEETEALTVFDRAAATNPAAALAEKGILLTQLGRLAEACEAFDRALVHEPAAAEAWYNKSNASTHAPGDPDIGAMENLLGGYCSYRERMLLHFALGKSHMDTGNADAAFLHWWDGNRMKRAIVDYDPDATTRRIASIAARPLHFDVSGASSKDRLSDLPVFVVGMPRSGSTLVEQILASHPQVHGAGELVQLRALFEADLPQTTDPDAPGAECRIAAAALGKLRRFSTDASRIIDKDLANFLHLGVIHRIFPRARIIHCRRNPLDTCFSAYTKLFIGNLAFTYDLGELGRYYRDYHALMAHWRRMLPSNVFLEIEYETLVAEPQNETHRLLDFLDLPWNDACLHFFKTDRTVSTSSFAQVRQPLYRSSIGRARSLGQHLQPLIEALGDLAPAG